jgi:hypothetical protein
LLSYYAVDDICPSCVLKFAKNCPLKTCVTGFHDKKGAQMSREHLSGPEYSISRRSNNDEALIMLNVELLQPIIIGLGD